MKISEVTVQNIADYMRLDDVTDIEIAEIEVMRDAAVAQIKAYTGLSDEEIDKHEDITQALFVIVTDMFDNRNYQLEKSAGTNKMVDTILNMHSVNLL